MLAKLKTQLSSFKPAGASLAAWPKILIGSVMVALAGGLLLFNLPALLPASPAEHQTIAQNQTIGNIMDNPLLLPYKLLVFVALHAPFGDDLTNLRLVSVVITCISIWLFFVTARRWYGTNSGLFASALFAASSWTLQTGRFGAGFCLIMLTIVALICLVSWLKLTSKKGGALVIYALVLGLALFMPAGLWLALVTTLLSYKLLAVHRSAASAGQVALASAIIIIACAVLVAAFVRDSHVLLQWVGLPEQLPGLLTIAKQAAFSILYLVLKGPMLPELWLAHTPVLDVASSVFLLIGLIFYGQHLTNGRTRLLLAFGVLGMVMIALNGPTALNFLVPVVYLVAGGGIAYFLHQWNKVFPRNPIARATSLTLLALLLACVVSFHTQRYFIAWRYSPDTVQVYSHSHLDSATSHLVQ